MKTVWIGLVLSVLAAPGTASAQNFFLSPFLDTTLTSPSGSGGASKAGFGLSLGKFGGVVGTETEVGYHPQILDNDVNALAKSHVFTASQNLLVGPRIGNVKPYGAMGAGDLYLNVGSTSLVPTDINSIAEQMSNNYFTINFGGGAMYFFNKRMAARGDLRYFKAYGFDLPDAETEEFSLKFNKFTFWRAAFGVTFAFGG